MKRGEIGNGQIPPPTPIYLLKYFPHDKLKGIPYDRDRMSSKTLFQKRKRKRNATSVGLS
jgi:hypothetical protein